ncbi:hypothetical protein Dimus_038354 [Dionaea muscipula]
MPLRSGFDHQAASSNSQARRTGTPPGSTGPVIQEARNEGIPDPVDDQQDGTANIQMAPDVYARFQEFQNLPAGEWEKFQRASTALSDERTVFSGGSNARGRICVTTATTCAEGHSSCTST